MQANKTVEINGRLYDATTGLPLKSADKTTKKPISPAAVKKRAAEVASSSIHTQPQRSKTLLRRITKKPNSVVNKRPQPGRHMDFARSAKITKFAAHPLAPTKLATAIPSSAHKPHPLVLRAAAKVAKPVMTVATALTPKQIKDTAITKALSGPIPKPADIKRTFTFSRRFTVISAIFAILIVGAYLTYVNMPALSVGFAASQAGIKATYPKYKPDGFSLGQPVTFSDGQVTLNFNSNSGNGSYTITQTRSSWDSSAVLNNVVKKAAGDNYLTTQEQGLTIYSYNTSATWVNGGIQYLIASSAPLSGDQIRHIATSL